LSDSERAKLNHPKRVWTSYWADTEPRAERDAKRTERAMKEPKENPHLQALADTEGERDTARRHAEDLRELLARVLAELEDHLSPELREAITRALTE
jgi:hypothetical protein